MKMALPTDLRFNRTAYTNFSWLGKGAILGLSLFLLAVAGVVHHKIQPATPQNGANYDNLKIVF